jgi:putative ABC transport system permease protein
MLFNYLKLSFRLMARNPFLTLINVVGLSIGFTVFFILWQYSQTELKSDQFHKGWEKIVRFGSIRRWTDDKVNWQESYIGLNDPSYAEKISKVYPEVKDLTRIHFQKNFKLDSYWHKKHEGEIFFMSTDKRDKQISFLEENVAYADGNLFDFFSLPLISGHPSQVLQRPRSIVLSEKIAQKYFGYENPIGKTMALNDSIDLEVTGVFKNLPRNTHLDFEILISMSTSFRLSDGDRLVGFHCYFKLVQKVDVKAFENRINNDFEKEITHIIWGDWPYGKAKIFLQPISEMAFNNYRRDFYQTKSLLVLTIFKFSAIIILILAWINYVNLNISSHKMRMKEIAARKAVGAKAFSFAIQFITESLVTNVLAVLVAITIIQLSKQPVARFFDFYILPWTELSLSGCLILGLVCLLGVLITGLYPCYVAMINSPKSLFGSFKTPGKVGSIHSSLSTFQYCTAIVMLMLVLVVYSQINFVLKKDIGVDRDHVVILDLPIGLTYNSESHLSYLREQIGSLPQVMGTTISHSVPNDNSENGMEMVHNLNDAGVRVQSNGGVDGSFIPFYGIKMLAGRNFKDENAADTSSIILSEGTAQRLGFKNPDEAIGSIIFLNRKRRITVVGVIADYQLKPFLKFAKFADYGGKPGLAFVYKNYGFHQFKPKKFSVRVDSDDFEKTLSEIKTIYTSVFPNSIFNWYFFDEIIAKHYHTETRARRQIAFFTLIALIIAGLGLLGMINNNVVEKTKEIGIRRVLGAEMHKIALVVVSNTIKQVVIATVIGIPLAYYIALQYLEKFSERITLQWWHYTTPMLILVTIMTVVTSTVLWKTARSNPVDALRYE